MGTAPHTLKGAVVELRLRTRRSFDDPVDILGVVVEQFNSAGDPQSTSTTKCLRMADHSLLAVVTLHNIQEDSIRAGDIIRCNRVGLKHHRQNSFQTTSDGDSQQEAHFCHLWHDPEAGCEWLRLGHVAERTRSVISRPDETSIPESMKTDPTSLDRLLQWYLSSNWFEERSPVLSYLPHCRRSLDEMLACVGAYGEVVARVKQVVDPPMVLPVGSKKRRRGSMLPSTGYAILMSRNGQIAPLLDPSKKFLPALRRAREAQLPVSLTYVRSRKAKQCSIRCPTASGEDVVLVLTDSSEVNILSPDCYEDGSSTARARLTMTFTQTQESVRRPLQLDAHIHTVQMRTPDTAISTQQVMTMDGKGLMRYLLENEPDSKHWKECRITLVDPNGLAVKVSADSEILVLLFGGIMPVHLRQSENLQTTATTFFESLIGEKIRLRWTVNETSDGRIASSVSLPSIPSSR
jgi:hypothetical protein